MPELRQLRAFVAVAEDLNFTRAAGRLFIAQQAVSRAVAQLERELGVTLLERTTREVRLTAAGEALLSSGREALARVDAALAEAQAIGRGLAGTVRVGVSPAVGSRVRSEVARVLRHGAKETSLSFLDIRPDQVGPLLRDRALDLALVRTFPGLPEIDGAALRPTPGVLHVPAGHRLADGGPVRLAELDGERLLCWNRPGTPYTDLLVTRLKAAGARVEPVQARITGGGEPVDLDDREAIALLPEGWPVGDQAVQVQLAEPVDLPLIVVWPAGTPPPAVARLLSALSSSKAGAR